MAGAGLAAAQTSQISSAYGPNAAYLDVTTGWGGGTNITFGPKDGVVKRLINFAPFTASAEDRAYDLSKPLYLSLRGSHREEEDE